MRPRLCLLSCTQSFCKSTQKTSAAGCWGAGPCDSGREGCCTALGPSEFSNMNATYSECSPDENTGCTDVPWRAKGAARTPGGVEPTVAEGTGIGSGACGCL